MTAQLRREAGRAVRDIGHALVGHDADPTLLAEVADALDALTARLEQAPRRVRDLQAMRDTIATAPSDGPDAGRADAIVGYDDRPFSGLASPWGLDLQARRDGDVVEAALTLRAAHEGAPGRSHGGIVAGLFDDVFGFVLGTIDQPAFTGELSIRYERPTPLDRPLLCRGWLDRRAGRKLWIVGELIDASEPDRPVLARASSLFITVATAGLGADTQQLPAPDA